MLGVDDGSTLVGVLQSCKELKVGRDEQGGTVGVHWGVYWSPAPVVYGKVNRKLSKVSVHSQKAAAELQATA